MRHLQLLKHIEIARVQLVTARLPVALGLSVQAQVVSGCQVVDHQIERLVAVGLLFIPDASLAATLDHGHAVFGRQLLVVVFRQIGREVDSARALHALPAAVKKILGGIGTDEP